MLYSTSLTIDGHGCFLMCETKAGLKHIMKKVFTLELSDEKIQEIGQVSSQAKSME